MKGSDVTDQPTNEPAVTASEGDMLPAERRQKLIDYFAVNMSGSNQDLARLFNTSVSTIRRDFDFLASQGIVKRTHGGAVKIRSRATFEPSLPVASQTAVEEKRAIALEAVKLLEPEQSVLIDTSSTLHIFAEEVARLTLPLTVVTNDTYVAHVLSMKPNFRILVPGGVCREGARVLLGEPGLSFLSEIRCDNFFMCAQAVDEVCASDTSLELVQLKRAMIGASARVTLMVDSSKSPSRAFYRICATEEIHEIITDEGLEAEDRARYETLGVKVRLAELRAETD